MTKSIIIHAQGDGFYGSAITIVPYSNVPIHEMLQEAAEKAGFRFTDNGEWERGDTRICFKDSLLTVGVSPTVIFDTGHADEDLKAVQDIMSELMKQPVEGAGRYSRVKANLGKVLGALKSDELDGEVSEEDNLEFQRSREELDKEPKKFHPTHPDTLPNDVVRDRNGSDQSDPGDEDTGTGRNWTPGC